MMILMENSGGWSVNYRCNAIAGRLCRPLMKGAKVFQQALASAEGDEAVGRWAMPFRQTRSAVGVTLPLVALGFPRGQALANVFSRRGAHRRGLSQRRYFFANILFGRLHRRNVSRHLLMLAEEPLQRYAEEQRHR